MLGLSGMANILAQLVSYPLYCIKTNMQIIQAADCAQNLKPQAPQDREGFVEVGRRLVRDRGVYRGLFSGFGLSVLKSMPAVASSFIIYEEAKSALGIAS